MTREDRAYTYIDSLFSKLDYTKAALLLGASKIGVPGAKKRFKRKIANMAGNKLLEAGSKVAASKFNLNEGKTVTSAKAVKDIALDMGTPNLGKLIVK